MILDVDVSSMLPVLRAETEALMRDKCRVERVAGRVLDDATLEYRDVVEVLYAGRCRVQVSATQPAESVEGGRGFVVTDAVLQLPVDGTVYRDGDRAVITEVAHDPALNGVVLSVTSREVKTHDVMRRLHVSEVRP